MVKKVIEKTAGEVGKKALTKLGPLGAIQLGKKGALGAADAVHRIYGAYVEYKKVEAQEITKREQIHAAERAAIATISTNREVILQYLDKSFDERKENFRRLFDNLDQAMAGGNLNQSGSLLEAIVKLAESSPFKSLGNEETLRTILKDPDTKWEI